MSQITMFEELFRILHFLLKDKSFKPCKECSKMDYNWANKGKEFHIFDFQQILQAQWPSSMFSAHWPKSGIAAGG